MSSRFAFHIENHDPRRRLPERVFIGRKEPETIKHVLLKFLGFALFYRDRLQVEAALHDDDIPFVPDLVQLDYTLRPAFWGECGEVSVAKLDRLAVKVPEAEIWVIKRSPAEAELLLRDMARHGLRRQRYRFAAFDAEMFDEMLAHLAPRNEVTWVGADFEPPTLQLDFNGLWFDAPFTVLEF